MVYKMLYIYRVPSPPPLTPSLFRTAFARLGELWIPPLTIVLSGGSALQLGGHTSRTTDDGDVVACFPDLAPVAPTIAQVGRELGLSELWLNDHAAAYHQFLPPDCRDRCHGYGSFGSLTVSLLSRQDLIVMKLMAFRAVDLDDLDALGVTDQEAQFVNDELPRLRTVDAKRARRIHEWLFQR
jgi:hypothetical protein